MDQLVAGLYETLITEGLWAELAQLDDEFREVADLRPAEAPDRLAWHVTNQIERALSDVSEKNRVEVGIRIANALLARLAELVDTDTGLAPVEPGRVLRAIRRRLPDGSPAAVVEPLTPLLDSTLLTGAPGEPTLLSELRSEVDTSDSIDLVMAFIRRSGINPLIDPLTRHCAEGKSLPRSYHDIYRLDRTTGARPAC